VLERFEAHHFRCFEKLSLPLGGRSVGLVGPNAAGKTSILEGLYFLGFGRSFRTTDRRQLVQTGAPGFLLRASVADSAGNSTLGARWTQGKLALELSGQPASGIGDLASRLRLHLIDPSVHRLIEGGPQERRRILDTGVFHVEQNYLSRWRSYRRALKQRNAALRSGSTQSASAWDDELVRWGLELDATRVAYVDRWNSAFEMAAGAFGLREAKLAYRRGWAGDLAFQDALRLTIARDAVLGVTSVGPHRGDVEVTLGGAGARKVVSRGQQKLLGSALVLAQLKVVHTAGHQPVLLLDDPAAELDVDNLGKFLAVIGELPIQLIATATFPAALEALKQLSLFHVKQDALTPVL
jgi:DNA replication and repair protein RecF